MGGWTWDQICHASRLHGSAKGPDRYPSRGMLADLVLQRDGARLHRCRPHSAVIWRMDHPWPMPLGLLLKGTQMFAQLPAAAV